MELGQILPLLLAGKPRHRERRGILKAMQLAEMEPRMCGEGTQGWDLCRLPAPALQPESPGCYRATSLFQAIPAVAGAAAVLVPSCNYKCFLPSLNHATDIHRSAIIWPHFLVCDVGTQCLSQRAERENWPGRCPSWHGLGTVATPGQASASSSAVGRTVKS